MGRRLGAPPKNPTPTSSQPLSQLIPLLPDTLRHWIQYTHQHDAVLAISHSWLSVWWTPYSVWQTTLRWNQFHAEYDAQISRMSNCSRLVYKHNVITKTRACCSWTPTVGWRTASTTSVFSKTCCSAVRLSWSARSRTWMRRSRTSSSHSTSVLDWPSTSTSRTSCRARVGVMATLSRTSSKLNCTR